MATAVTKVITLPLPGHLREVGAMVEATEAAVDEVTVRGDKSALSASSAQNTTLSTRVPNGWIDRQTRDSSLVSVTRTGSAPDA